MVSEAISQGDLAAANFLVAEKYIDAIRAIATAPNQKVVIVPIEAAGLAGHARRHRRAHEVRFRRGRCVLGGAACQPERPPGRRGGQG